MRKKLFSVFVAALAVAALTSTAAVAGEVTGSGKPIAIHARSVCAFSGLNDHVTAEEPDRTQSFGTLVRAFAKAGLVSGEATTGIGGPSGTHGVGIPGGACNPTVGAEE